MSTYAYTELKKGKKNTSISVQVASSPERIAEVALDWKR